MEGHLSAIQKLLQKNSKIRFVFGVLITAIKSNISIDNLEHA